MHRDNCAHVNDKRKKRRDHATFNRKIAFIQLSGVATKEEIEGTLLFIYIPALIILALQGRGAY